MHLSIRHIVSTEQLYPLLQIRLVTQLNASSCAKISRGVLMKKWYKRADVTCFLLFLQQITPYCETCLSFISPHSFHFTPSASIHTILFTTILYVRAQGALVAYPRS